MSRISKSRSGRAKIVRDEDKKKIGEEIKNRPERKDALCEDGARK
jgi:hypothetical protein